jgi:hypothetical protein
LETYEKIIDKKTTLVLPGDSKLFKKLTQWDHTTLNF